MAPICDRFDVDRRKVRRIFVDETMVRIRGSQAWVWVAYEPDLKVFLSFRVSYNKSTLNAYLFLKELRNRYGMSLANWEFTFAHAAFCAALCGLEARACNIEIQAEMVAKEIRNINGEKSRRRLEIDITKPKAR